MSAKTEKLRAIIEIYIVCHQIGMTRVMLFGLWVVETMHVETCFLWCIIEGEAYSKMMDEDKN